MMERSFENIYNEVNNWQTIQFPLSDEISKLAHLKEEVEELIHELQQNPRNYDKIRSEFADCYLLLGGSAGKVGFTPQDVIDIQITKLKVNKERVWHGADENNVYRHKK